MGRIKSGIWILLQEGTKGGGLWIWMLERKNIARNEDEVEVLLSSF